MEHVPAVAAESQIPKGAAQDATVWLASQLSVYMAAGWAWIHGQSSPDGVLVLAPDQRPIVLQSWAIWGRRLLQCELALILQSSPLEWEPLLPLGKREVSTLWKLAALLVTGHLGNRMGLVNGVVVEDCGVTQSVLWRNVIKGAKT